MKKKICTVLRDKAERDTVGQSTIVTRRLYRKNKREYKQVIKEEKRIPVYTKLSKREQRIASCRNLV